jgi:hypothetical protein
MQSLHADRQFVQFLILKHIVSRSVPHWGFFSDLIDLQFGVWKHLPMHGVGYGQQKQHFFDIYDIVN